MRRIFVLALAFLSVSLTGGSCEFRASTGTPVHPPPPAVGAGDGDSGLLIVVNTGDSIPPPNGTTTQTTAITAALAVSVLSAPNRTTPSPAVSPVRVEDAGPDFGTSPNATEIGSIERPIPEPSAVLLFGLGTLFLGRRVRRSARRPATDQSADAAHDPARVEADRTRQ